MLGIAGSLSYCALVALRHKTFHVGATALVFFGFFAIPPCMSIIYAGYKGQAQQLPPDWRQYISLAGVIGCGIAIKGVVEMFRAAAAQMAEKKPPDDPL